MFTQWDEGVIMISNQQPTIDNQPVTTPAFFAGTGSLEFFPPALAVVDDAVADASAALVSLAARLRSKSRPTW